MCKHILSSSFQYKKAQGVEKFNTASGEMALAMKYVGLLVLLAVLGITVFKGVDAAGACGNASPDTEAWKLIPCAAASQSERVTPSKNCCVQVKKIGQNPDCLCAVLLSNTAKASGVKPEIAMSIPKRCNHANRPVGYKCGGLFLYITSPFVFFS